MEASDPVGGGGWSAVPGRSREAAPPAPAHRRGGGGGPWLAFVGVGEVSERVVELEIWYGERWLATYQVEVSKEGGAALVAGLAGAVVQKVAVGKRGYNQPAAVQQYALRIATAESELMARAMVRSGKTAAMVLVQMAAARGSRGERRGEWNSFHRAAGLRALGLILAPTRDFSTHQLCDRLGYLVDMINTSRIRLEATMYLVMAEADRLLDMGFEPQTNEWYPDISKSVLQTTIFSAVFPPEIQSLNSDFLSTTGWKVGTSTQLIGQKVDISNDKEKRGFLKQPDYTTRPAARQHIGISGVRLLLIIFAIVLFSSVKSVSALDYGTNRTMFCPASNTQFKRTLRNFDGWITEIREAMFLEEQESESKITQSPENECIEVRGYEQFFSEASAALSMISNFSPLVPIIGGNVDPGRRKLLCRCSLALLASNLSWIFFFGSDECKVWMGYISLVLGCWWQGCFAWFFWQRENNSMKSLSSVIVCLVSGALAVLLGSVANAQFMRVGPKVLTGTSTISGLGGIFGIIFNAISIYLRWISSSRRFNIISFVLTLCGAGGAVSSMIALKWLNGITQLTFKIGISILFLGRLFDAYLMLSYRHALASHSNDINDPLLITDNSENVDIANRNEGGAGGRENGTSSAHNYTTENSENDDIANRNEGGAGARENGTSSAYNYTTEQQTTREIVCAGKLEPSGGDDIVTIGNKHAASVADQEGTRAIEDSTLGDSARAADDGGFVDSKGASVNGQEATPTQTTLPENNNITTINDGSMQRFETRDGICSA